MLQTVYSLPRKQNDYYCPALWKIHEALSEPEQIPPPLALHLYGPDISMKCLIKLIGCLPPSSSYMSTWEIRTLLGTVPSAVSPQKHTSPHHSPYRHIIKLGKCCWYIWILHGTMFFFLSRKGKGDALTLSKVGTTTMQYRASKAN